MTGAGWPGPSASSAGAISDSTVASAGFCPGCADLRTSSSRPPAFYLLVLVGADGVHRESAARRERLALRVRSRAVRHFFLVGGLLRRRPRSVRQPLRLLPVVALRARRDSGCSLIRSRPHLVLLLWVCSPGR